MDLHCVLWTFQYFSSVISIQSQYYLGISLPVSALFCFLCVLRWALFVGIKLQFWALYLLSLCSQLISFSDSFAYLLVLGIIFVSSHSQVVFLELVWWVWPFPVGIRFPVSGRHFL
ncbi:4648_t:CDS:2 [Dentiscutata heterogama]|uniref:4648_t:CDS:1 n=1 Tax=Dentiscutata heterogama TaxID=1316150 RepID=A0ACA9KNX5_9GLOM|nr:4648_t:CDS:2 [Dentiscutata heterogama]